jgi:hypothetical protein
MNIEKFEILKQIILSIHTKTTIAFIFIIGFLCYYITYEEHKIATLQVKIDVQKVETDSSAIDQRIQDLTEKNKQLNKNLSDIDSLLKKLKKQENGLKKSKDLADKQIEDFWNDKN